MMISVSTLLLALVAVLFLLSLPVAEALASIKMSSTAFPLPTATTATTQLVIPGITATISPPPTTTTTSTAATATATVTATSHKQGINITWEPSVATEIKRRFENAISQTNAPVDQPFMVRIVGIPGSGKSTSCEILASMLTHQLGIESLVVPFDGYHYPLATLQSFPNSQDVIYRRGAPDTFDAKLLQQDLLKIRHNNNEHNTHHETTPSTTTTQTIISLPGFDHAKGDPTPNEHTFQRGVHKIVIVEGLYLLHNEHGWEALDYGSDDNNNDSQERVFDLSIFIDSDVDKCVQRLKIRNQCIPGYTKEEIDLRCDEVDRVNAMTVLKSRERADIYVRSSSM